MYQTHWNKAFFITISLGSLLALLFFVGCTPEPQPKPPEKPIPEKTFAGSIHALAFAPDGTLFVGDAKNGAVFAFPKLETGASSAAAFFNLRSIDSKIAASLGAKLEDIQILDMVIHPKTKNPYLAVRRGSGTDARYLVMRVEHTGKIEEIKLETLGFTKAQLQNIPKSDKFLWKKTPVKELSITDIEYYDGHVYVAGIVGDKFTSSLHKLAYPFDAKVKTSAIEMYHTVHNQRETRAPIRALTFSKIDGKPHVIAVYTCTPLVVFPLSDLQDGKKVSGKTIAELGYGNTPLDIMTLKAPKQFGSQELADFVLVVNRDQSSQLISLSEVKKAIERPGLSKPVFPSGGMPFMNVPLSGVLRIKVQNDNFLLTIRRNQSNGRIDILSFLKGAYFRLSDHQSEYDIYYPKYPKEQEHFKKFHHFARGLEGFSVDGK